MFGPRLPYWVKDSGLFGDGVLHWAAETMPTWPGETPEGRVIGPMAGAMDTVATSWTLMRRAMRENDEGVRNFVRDIYRKMGATTGAGRPGSRPDPGLPDWALFADGGAAARAAAQSRTDRTRYREALALIRTETLDQPLDGRPGYSPIQQLGDLLDAGQVRWGILTDGARWRLYRRGSYTTFEINLEAILQHPAVDRAEAFRWFYTFFRPGAFAIGEQRGYLDRLWAEAHGPEPVVQSAVVSVPDRAAISRPLSVDEEDEGAGSGGRADEDDTILAQETAPVAEAAPVARRATPAPAEDTEVAAPAPAGVERATGAAPAAAPAKAKTVRRKAPAPPSAPTTGKGKGAKGTKETKGAKEANPPKGTPAAPPAAKPAPVEAAAPVAAPPPEAEAPAPEPRRLSPEEEAQAFLDAAEAVLRRQGGRRPMHYRAIMEQAVELDLLGPLATAASSTMSAKIMRDIDRREVEGQPPLFSRRGPGLFGLAEWDPQIYGRGSD